MGDLLVHASGLRRVAVATVVGIALAVLRSGIEVAGSRLDPVALEHARTSIGLCVAVIAVLWISGAIGAARGDDRRGAVLFSLAATFAFVGVVADAMVVADPLVDPAWTARAAARLAFAGRLCWAAAQLFLAIALARRAWLERRGGAMAAAAFALVLALPMLALDPVAIAVQWPRLSVAAARFLGVLPTVVVGGAIAIAIVSLPKPRPSVWRALARALVLIRAALTGLALLGAASIALVVVGEADPVRLRVAMTGPLVLLATATAIGALAASLRSIRWARACLLGGAMSIAVLAVFAVWMGVLVPLELASLPPGFAGIAMYAGFGLTAVALALLTFGCSRLDRTLHRRGTVALVALSLAALIQVALVVLQNRGIAVPVSTAAIVGALLLLATIAIAGTLLLLGHAATLAETREFTTRLQASRQAAKRAADYGRRVHEHWRATNSR